MKIKLIKTSVYIIFILFLTVYLSLSLSAQIFKIPTQKINLYKILGDNNRKDTQTINAFEISEFITYKEYKFYLESVKKDSSQKFYLSQFPDTNISNKEVYKKYTSGNEYDNFPIVGISWENAMNYCKWKTLKDNKESLSFIYRLPNCSEWLAAYNYIEKNKIKNDFNKNYSDWLLNSFDESILYLNDIDITNNNVYGKFPFDYTYYHLNNDPLVLKRKIIMGDSYLYQHKNFIDYYSNEYGYATEGYRQITFRYVKEPIDQMRKLEKSNDSYYKNHPLTVLEYWGIKKK